MMQFLHYYSRFERLKGGVGGLPAWARTVLGIVALPGIVLIGLSIVAFLGSLLALLLLTVPVYRLLKAITAPGHGAHREEVVNEPFGGGRRHIDVTIVE